MYNEFQTFSGKSYFGGKILLQFKEGSKPYQALLRYIANALQQLFKEELDWLQQQQTITLLRVDKLAGVVQQLFVSTKTQMERAAMSGPARLEQVLI